MFKKIVLVLLMLVTGSLYAGATSWYDIEIVDGLILVDAEISGVKTKAALDTGASSAVVNVDFLKKNNINYKNGRKVILQGVFGERKDRLVKGVDINLFGIDIPLKGSLPTYGEADYALLMGLPFFKNFVVQIDYPNSRMRMLTRDSVNLNEIANVPLKFTDNKSALVAQLKVKDGPKLDLLLDTGNTGAVIIERQFASEKGWVEKYAINDVEAKVSGVVKSNIDMQLLSIPEIQFGPYPMESVLISVPANNMNSNIKKEKAAPRIGKKINARSGYDGILGYDLLRHFLVTLDAKSGKMHIIAE